ncbi:MAG TPA: hypothetical protein VFF06_35955 [Polyangia bacterium]|nr:hypothetical protein [Polyangia bacterium]
MRRAAVMMVLALAAPAAAEESRIQRSGPEVFPSRHEVSAQLGYQAGFGGSLGSPSGIKLSADYNFRFHPMAWFDLQVGNVFGFGGGNGPCVGNPAESCYRGGFDFQISAGVRFKFHMKTIPLVVEVPLLMGLDALYGRDCGDTAVTIPVSRGGASVKYFITRRIGIGAGANLAFGPSFHQRGAALCTSTAYSDFYGAFDFNVGAEFVL